MIKIVVDDKIPFLKGALEPFAEVVYLQGEKINNAILHDADALITRTRTACNKELLDGTKVRFIATATIGFDHIDTDYCQQNDIQWANAPGCNSGSVMQYMASALVRLSLKYDFEFSEKTIGIIGHGNIGSKVSKLASALGFKVLINDPPLQRSGLLLNSVSLNEIIDKADIITFHVPLNTQGIDKTLHIGNEEFLNSIKSTTIIINSSRGDIIDNNALKKALKKKKLKGAVLDVWENEPTIDQELLDLVDYATPHIAGYSADGKANGTAMSVQAISDFFGFELKDWFPLNVPLPSNTELKIGAGTDAVKNSLSQCILSTYDIQLDHERLIKSVETFENQRGDYPLRREFANYLVKIQGSNPFLEKQIKKLGFKF